MFFAEFLWPQDSSSLWNLLSPPCCHSMSFHWLMDQVWPSTRYSHSWLTHFCGWSSFFFKLAQVRRHCTCKRKHGMWGCTGALCLVWAISVWDCPFSLVPILSACISCKEVLSRKECQVRLGGCNHCCKFRHKLFIAAGWQGSLSWPDESASIPTCQHVISERLQRWLARFHRAAHNLGQQTECKCASSQSSRIVCLRGRAAAWSPGSTARTREERKRRVLLLSCHHEEKWTE